MKIINAPRDPRANSLVDPQELHGKSPEERKGIIAERKLDAKVARMEQNPLSTLEKKVGNADLGTILKRVYVDKNTGQLELSSNAFSHFLRKLTGHTTNSDALKLAAIKEYGMEAQDKLVNGHYELPEGTTLQTLTDANKLLESLSGAVETAEFDEDAELQLDIFQRFRPETESVASEASLEDLPETSESRGSIGSASDDVGGAEKKVAKENPDLFKTSSHKDKTILQQTADNPATSKADPYDSGSRGSFVE